MEHSDHREVFDDHAEHPHGFDTTEPKGGFIALFGVATVITLVVTILGIQYYFDQAIEQQVYNVVLAPESDQLRDLHATEDTQLSSYQYVDRGQGTVRLTIDRAMDLVAKEAAENKFSYPTQPYRVKTAEELAAGPGAAPAAPGKAVPGKAAPGANTTNATPAPPAK
jgi:hypothetical protein